MATRTATRTRATTTAKTLDIPVRVVRVGLAESAPTHMGIFRAHAFKAAREADDEYADDPTFGYWLGRMVELQVRLRMEGIAQPRENKPKAPEPVEAEADGRPEAVGE